MSDKANWGGDWFPERPATAEELEDVQAQLAMTANDPNLTIVESHTIDLSDLMAPERRAEWE